MSINCDIHTRARTKRILKAAGVKKCLGMDEIMNASVDGSGYNAKIWFVRFEQIYRRNGKTFPEENVLISFWKFRREFWKKQENTLKLWYTAMALSKILWERFGSLQTPVVSPAFTDGLRGTPNEVKLKYLADNDFKDLSGEALKEAISKRIKEKDDNLVGNMVSQGTTPRQLTDLIGSLCDLTSGSGDKGTPVVLVQGYFDNYTN